MLAVNQLNNFNNNKRYNGKSIVSPFSFVLGSDLQPNTVSVVLSGAFPLKKAAAAAAKQ